MSEPVRAVLVGCGDISRTWLKACRRIDGVDLVGLVDIQAGLAATRAAQFGLDDAFVGTELDACLRATTPEAVFDCTVPAAHEQVTLTALAAGCHVLGEKPMSTGLPSARRMVDAATGSGRLYAVTQTRRYDRNLRRVKALVDSGAIGPLTTVTTDFFGMVRFGGFRGEMRHVLLQDRAVHLFDAARLLTGAEATRVHCVEWNPSGSSFAHDASAVATFEMTGGIVYSFRGSWSAPGLPTAYPSEWRIIGERGTIRWDGADSITAEVASDGDDLVPTLVRVSAPEEGEPGKGEGHTSVIREFVECVRGHQTPETICTDNIRTLAMVIGAIASAESRHPVELEAV